MVGGLAAANAPLQPGGRTDATPASIARSWPVSTTIEATTIATPKARSSRARRWAEPVASTARRPQVAMAASGIEAPTT